MAQDENIVKLEHPYSTPDVITQMQRHYNPEQDIIGRAEFMPENQFKVTAAHGVSSFACTRVGLRSFAVCREMT